jgi:hypothetical protein
VACHLTFLDHPYQLDASKGIFDYPSFDGGVIDLDPQLSQEFFDMASAQRIPMRMTSRGPCAPLKFTAILALPSCLVKLARPSIPQSDSNEDRDRTLVLPDGTVSLLVPEDIT